jgi:hypothetical protein
MSREYISIPVPVDRVHEVYELLARPRGETPQLSSPPPSNGGAGLDPALIERAYRESSDKMRQVFNHLAANAGTDVVTQELGDAVGYTAQQMAGTLGAFGRRWKNRYHGGKAAKWPFSARWDYGTGNAVYQMDPEVAEVIKRA